MATKFNNTEGLNKAMKRAALHLTPPLPEERRHEAYDAARVALEKAGEPLHDVLKQLHRANRTDLVAKVEAVLKELDALPVHFR